MPSARTPLHGEWVTVRDGSRHVIRVVERTPTQGAWLVTVEPDGTPVLIFEQHHAWHELHPGWPIAASQGRALAQPKPAPAYRTHVDGAWYDDRRDFWTGFAFGALSMTAVVLAMIAGVFLQS